MAHPDFGRSVNPISTRGDRLCQPNYSWHPRIFRPSDGPEVWTVFPKSIYLEPTNLRMRIYDFFSTFFLRGYKVFILLKINSCIGIFWSILISIENFHLLEKQDKWIFMKKFVDSGLVKHVMSMLYIWVMFSKSVGWKKINQLDNSISPPNKPFFKCSYLM